MQKSRVRSAVVLGAGPAGLLATRALDAVGVRVALVLGGAAWRRSPSRHHVHVLPPSTRHAIRAVIDGDAGVLDDPVDREHPDGVVLDSILEAACLPRAAVIVPGMARRVLWGDAGGVRVLTPHGEVNADVLVDATGTARASFAWASAHAGRDVPMDFVPGSWRYTSVVMGNAPEFRAGDLTTARDPETGWGVLLLGLGQGRVRATLQTPASTPPVDLPALRQALHRIGPQHASRVLAEGMAEGPLHRWGPHPVTRAALEDCADMPAGWFPVGDALLVTPPHLAGGVRHAAEHVSIVARGIASGACSADVRRALTAQARASWLEGTVADALSVA
jgi:flavin-dependent dehydrogenase